MLLANLTRKRGAASFTAGDTRAVIKPPSLIPRCEVGNQCPSEWGPRVSWPGGRGPLRSTPNFDAGSPAGVRLLLYIHPDPPWVGFNFPGQLK